MADDAQRGRHPDGEARFFGEFAHHGLFRRLAGLHAAAGEFPQTAPGTLGQTLLDEDAVVAGKDTGHHLDGSDLRLFARHGALMHDAQMQGRAETGQGTLAAAGLLAADQGAQLHHGLVVAAGLAFGQDAAGQLRDACGGRAGFDRAVHIEDAGDDPFHVGVDAGHGQVEGDAGDGGRGVGADTGQGADGFGIGREDAAVFLHDQTGGGQQVAGTGIVAQALPGVQHLLLGGGGQGVQVGEALHPAQKVADAALHLGLLEHDLRDPDLVGRVMASPGQGPGIGGEPGEQGLLQLGEVVFGRTVAGRRHGTGDGDKGRQRMLAGGLAGSHGRSVAARALPVTPPGRRGAHCLCRPLVV